MDSDSFLAGLVAQISVQKGAEEVNSFLEKMKTDYGGTLPKGLKGARYVMMAWENQSDDACLDPTFLEGLEALGKAGLIWEFCCEPRVAPYLPSCICPAFVNLCEINVCTPMYPFSFLESNERLKSKAQNISTLSSLTMSLSSKALQSFLR